MYYILIEIIYESLCFKKSQVENTIVNETANGECLIVDETTGSEKKRTRSLVDEPDYEEGEQESNTRLNKRIAANNAEEDV